MEDKLEKIIQHYGVNKTLKHLHSEHYELDEAVLECIHGYDYSPTQLARHYENHIAEEIADMLCMLNQISLYFNISEEQIYRIMEEKVDRQLKRMEEEVNGR